MNCETYATVIRYGVRKNTQKTFSDFSEARDYAIKQSRFTRNRNVLYKIIYHDLNDESVDRYYNGERRF